MPRSSAPRLRRAKATAPTAAAAEMLEERILPAITILVDYSLDKSGFFNDPRARAAIESVAAELGSRLTHHIGELLPGYYKTLKPSTLTYDYVYSSAPADTLRLFAGGTIANGPGTSILAECGSIDSLAIRNFDFTREYNPFTTTMAVGTIWNWDFDGTNTASDAYDFKAVMRHELMHGLGIGQAQTWYKWIQSDGSNDVFTGPTARAVEGGRNPQTTPFGFDGAAHFNQGEDSLMQPFYSTVRRPTALDWAALNDIGWEVVMPGKYADVFTRASDGTWYAAVSAKGLSNPIQFGKWDETAGWRDVAQGDFNGDGLTDVIGRTANGEWIVGINGPNGFTNTYFGQWTEVDGYGRLVWRDVKVGDFDGDGKTDVAGRSVDGAWYVGLSTGTGFRTEYWGNWVERLTPYQNTQWTDVRFGDFNGDHKMDIAGRTAAGEWYVGTSTGFYFSMSKWAAWSETAGWRDVQVADIDANGRDDLVGRTATGEWYVALSFGDSAGGGWFLTNRWTQWNEAAGWRDVKIADFAGDGRPDILARTATGDWYLAQNIGGMSFSTIPFGRWYEAAGWQTVLVGDFDANLRNDILAQARDGSWWLGEDDGTKLNFKAYGNWTAALGWKDFGVTKHLFPASTGPAVQSTTTGTGTGGGFTYHPEKYPTGATIAGSTSKSAVAPTLKTGAATTSQSTTTSQAIAPISPAAPQLVASGGQSTKTGGSASSPQVAFPPASPVSHDLFWSLADRDESLAAGLLSAV